jgi:ferredoxin
MNLTEMREELKKVIRRDDVELIIGYEKGTFGFHARASFFRNEKDVERFIFSPLCTQNLSTYLKFEREKKIGIVVRGCDCRSLLQLCQENFVRRENLLIIGVPCRGVVDTGKIKSFPLHGDVVEKGDRYTVISDGKREEYRREELIAEKCKFCISPLPLEYDVLLGEPSSAKKPVQPTYEDILRNEEKSIEERREYWDRAFSRCIRCHACRNVCPLCFCRKCSLESLLPQWVHRSSSPEENALYQIMRVFHLAGRCTGCEECTRVCPMGIPLRELTRKLEKEVFHLFNHLAGMGVEGKNVLATFSPEEDF